MPRTPPRGRPYRAWPAPLAAARWSAVRWSAVLRLAVQVAAVAAPLILLAGCSGPAEPPMTISGLRWIISEATYDRLAVAAPGLAGELLAATELIVVRAPDGRPDPAGGFPAGAVPAELFRSYRQFADQVRDGVIAAGVGTVVYDPESWKATPLHERLDPMRYLALFARTAKSHGYRPVLAPGRDLTLTKGGACAKRQGERVGEAYVRCGIPRSAADAPVFVVQAAPQELDLPALQRLVSASARQARAANPDVVIIATISTAPGGVPADPAALVRAAETMRPYVQGFMLNTTRATTPAAAAFLRALPTDAP